jgi:YesN/AraC family two-component response regulator
MPKLNGRQLVEAMAERLPSLKVIYMSGYTNTAIVRRGVFDDVPFLWKPFSIGDLATNVRETLDAA